MRPMTVPTESTVEPTIFYIFSLVRWVCDGVLSPWCDSLALGFPRELKIGSKKKTVLKYAIIGVRQIINYKI
jgi:hypothetical protein